MAQKKTQSSPVSLDDAYGCPVIEIDKYEGRLWFDITNAADYHLISAAPDLYEALGDLVSSLECLDIDLFILREEIKIARAALSKARGE